MVGLGVSPYFKCITYILAFMCSILLFVPNEDCICNEKGLKCHCVKREPSRIVCKQEKDNKDSLNCLDAPYVIFAMFVTTFSLILFLFQFVCGPCEDKWCELGINVLSIVLWISAACVMTYTVKNAVPVAMAEVRKFQKGNSTRYLYVSSTYVLAESLFYITSIVLIVETLILYFWPNIYIGERTIKSDVEPAEDSLTPQQGSLMASMKWFQFLPPPPARINSKRISTVGVVSSISPVTSGNIPLSPVTPKPLKLEYHHGHEMPIKFTSKLTKQPQEPPAENCQPKLTKAL